MATTSALLDICGKLYNHSTYSDATLTFNDKPYNLMLIVVEEFAPGLFKEFQADSVTPAEPTPSTDPTDQVASDLSLWISKLQPAKKVTTFADPRISEEILEAVLESLYGKTLDISLSNIGEVHVLSTKFGIESLVTKCLTVFKDNTKLEAFLESYAQALSEDLLTIKLHFSVLLEKLDHLPRDKLVEFAPKLKFESVLEIVKTNTLTCDEDLLYELVDSWCKVNTSKDNNANALTLIRHINLDALSVDLLLTKAKDNVNIDRNSYVQALESKLRFLSADFSSSASRSCGSFAIGKINGTYSDYHLITAKEAQSPSFLKLFNEHYFDKSSIRCLDNFTADVVCCTTNPFAVKENSWVRLHDAKLKKHEYTYLKFSTHEDPILPVHLQTIHVSRD